MSDAVQVTLDGTKVEVPVGLTILQACRREGIEIPTLCYLETLDPINACRLCVVELQGARVLVPSCSRKVEAGMIVETESERVRHSRRLILEFLAGSVDLSLAGPDLLAAIDRYGARPERFGSAKPSNAPIIDNNLYVRDYGRCVLCYRCVDACGEQAQNTFAIAVAGRGFGATIATEYSAPLPETACVYCGNCVGVCPTGALMAKSEHDMREEGRWDESRQTKTDTICPYCGVGCTLTLHVQDNSIVKATSPPGDSVTHGNLCIKGRFGWEFVQIRKQAGG